MKMMRNRITIETDCDTLYLSNGGFCITIKLEPIFTDMLEQFFRGINNDDGTFR